MTRFFFFFFFFYSVAALVGRSECLERKHQVAGWTTRPGHFWFICAFQNYVADLFTWLPFVSPPKFCSGNHPHPRKPYQPQRRPPTTSCGVIYSLVAMLYMTAHIYEIFVLVYCLLIHNESLQCMDCLALHYVYLWKCILSIRDVRKYIWVSQYHVLWHCIYS